MTKRELLENEDFINADMDADIFISVDWYFLNVTEITKEEHKTREILVIR